MIQFDIAMYVNDPRFIHIIMYYLLGNYTLYLKIIHCYRYCYVCERYKIFNYYICVIYLLILYCLGISSLALQFIYSDLLFETLNNKICISV